MNIDPSKSEKDPNLPNWPKVAVENRGNSPLDFEVTIEGNIVPTKFMWGDPKDRTREDNLSPLQVLTKDEGAALYARHTVHLAKLIKDQKLTINRG